MHYVGIDVGKWESTFFVVDDAGKRLSKGKIESTAEAAAALVEELAALQEGVEVAIESGNVTFTLSRAMQERGADVFVVHPLANALIARSRKKTDTIDAKTLADQRRRHILPEHSVHIPTEACEDLRHLLTARESLVGHRTRLTNQLLAVLSRYGLFPAKRVFKLASRWRELRGGLSALRRADRLIVRQYIRQALLLIEQLQRTDKEIHRAVALDFADEHTLLRSIPGIGAVTAATIIAWGTPIERFETARHFTSYAGLVPAVRRSSTLIKDGHGKTQKSGNRHLGRNLVQAALTFSGTTGPTHELWAWYQQVRKKRGWRKARVALARKLAAVAYGVLTHRTPYDPAYVARVLSSGDDV